MAMPVQDMFANDAHVCCNNLLLNKKNRNIIRNLPIRPRSNLIHKNSLPYTISPNQTILLTTLYSHIGILQKISASNRQREGIQLYILLSSFIPMNNCWL